MTILRRDRQTRSGGNLGKRRDRDWDTGCVYYAKSDGSQIKEVAFPVMTPNGCGLSPDGKALYV
ncbi:MAG: SMP-30/gluconolactonase/LRE family protein, partial [Hyphomicrobium denitrificans]|nr:SMP-30/gluconolactonase/LRE family protein [Hyphomicrobium denitrificans]